MFQTTNQLNFWMTFGFWKIRKHDLADSLTKLMPADFLRSVLKIGRYQLTEECSTLQVRKEAKLAKQGLEDRTPLISWANEANLANKNSWCMWWLDSGLRCFASLHKSRSVRISKEAWHVPLLCNSGVTSWWKRRSVRVTWFHSHTYNPMQSSFSIVKSWKITH